MASESSLSQSSLTNKDEFEGLEVTEFDANALWDLLYDEPGEKQAQSAGGAPMQATDAVVGPNPDSAVESYCCLDDIKNDEVQDFDWLHMMEETYAPCNDMGDWYGGPCVEEMNEIIEIGDHTLSDSGIMSDEIGYIRLWQDN